MHTCSSKDASVFEIISMVALLYFWADTISTNSWSGNSSLHFKTHCAFTDTATDWQS